MADYTISVDRITDCRKVVLDSNSIYKVKNSDTYTLIATENNNVEVTIDYKVVYLAAHSFIIGRKGAAVKIITEGKKESNVEVYIISFCSNKKSFGPFFYKANRLEYDFDYFAGIEKEFINQGDHSRNKYYMSDSIASGMLLHFLITSKRRYYSDHNPDDGYIIPKFRTASDVYGAITRRMKNVIEEIEKYSIRRNQSEDNNKLISEVLVYLREHIYESVTLDDLVGIFYFSKTYLCREFKKVVGESIIEYFIELKMKESKRLIRETELNFTQISEKLNFSSVHYFSSMFKKQFGYTPTEYAKRTRQ